MDTQRIPADAHLLGDGGFLLDFHGEDFDKAERRAGDEGADEFDDERGRQSEGRIERDAHGGRADARDAFKQLVEGVDAQKMPFRDEHGHGRRHPRRLRSVRSRPAGSCRHASMLLPASSASSHRYLETFRLSCV